MTTSKTAAIWSRAVPWLGRGALALLALVVGLWLTRGFALHPWLLAKVERDVAESFGAELSIGAFESTWFGGATLRDVRWEAPTGALRTLEAPELTAEWSLWGWLFGSERWFESVRGEVRSIELASAPADEEAEDKAPAALPRHLPAVDLKLGQLTYRLSASESIDLRAATLAIEVEGDWERARLHGPELAWTTGEQTISRPIAIDARYQAGRIAVAPSKVGDLVSISGGEIDLSRLDRGDLGWSVSGRMLGGGLNSAGKVIDGRIDTTFSANRLDIRSLGDVLGPDFEAALPRELWPQLSIDGKLAPVNGSDALALTLDWVEARTPALIVRGVELKALLGESDWREALRAARGRLVLEAVDQRAPDGSGPEVDLNLTAQLGEGRALMEGLVRTAGGSLEVSRGELTLGPVDALISEALADFDVRANFVDLAPLGSAFGLEWSGGLKGLIEVNGPLLAPTGQMSAEAVGVSISGFELGAVDLVVIAQDGHVDVLDCELVNTSWNGSLSGRWIAAERRVEGLELEVTGGGLPIGPIAPAKFTVSLAASGAIEAPAGAFALTINDLGAAGFEQLDLRGAGEFEGRSVRFDSLLAEDGELALFARGHGTAGERGGFAARLEELELTGPGGAWILTEPGSAVRSGSAGSAGSVFEVGPLALESRTEERTGRARVRWTGGDLEANFEGFELGPVRERVLPPTWSLGGLSGTLSRKGSGASFDLALDRVVAARGQRALSARELSFAGSLDEAERLDLALALSNPGGDALSLTLKAPFAPGVGRAGSVDRFLQAGPVELQLASGPLALNEILGLLGTAPGIDGELALDAELAGSWDDLRGNIALTGTDLTSPETREALGGPLRMLGQLELGERVELTSGSLEGPDGHLLSFAGGVDAAPDLVTWLDEPAALLDAPLSVDGRFDLPLRGWTERIESIRRLEGRADGELTLAGTLNTPEPSGRVDLRDVELRLTSAVPSIRHLNAQLDLSATRADIADMRLEFGGAPCDVRGAFDWGQGFRFDGVTLDGENLLIARSSTTKLRANLVGVTVSGPLDALETAGEFVITEGRFAQDVDLLSKLMPNSARSASKRAPSPGFRPSFARTGPLSTMRFDLAVKSAGQVRVKGNLYDLSVRPDLWMRGTGEVPLFEGEIYVDPSTLTLPSGRLGVDSGVLRFSRDAPFTPRITLSSGMETKGYDIDAQIDGPLGDPEILLSSTPALPSDQLLMLFLAGQTPSGSSQGLAAAQTVGVYLAQDALVRWLGGGTKEADSLLDNLVFEIGADVTHTGAPTLIGRYYLDSRRKRTGRTTYLLAEKDVWDKTNFGFGIRFRFQ